MRKGNEALTNLQQATLAAWADKDLRRRPSYRAVAERAGLAAAPSVPLMLKALKDKGYLDENSNLTRKARDWLNAANRDKV